VTHTFMASVMLWTFTRWRDHQRMTACACS